MVQIKSGKEYSGFPLSSSGTRLTMRGIILPAFLVLFLCCGALGTNLQLPPGTSALSEGIQFWWGIAKHIVVTDQSEPRKIRVFAATLPRTGSSSLEVALETLGYNAMHGAEHMAHAHAVRDADAGRRSVDDVVQDMEQFGFDVAGLDLMHHQWRWAVEKEDVKVILTVRDIDKWVNSMQPLDPLIDVFRMRPYVWQFRLYHVIHLLEELVANITATSTPYNGAIKDHEALKAGYHRHVEGVKSAIPPSRLLVYNVKEGWEPLCRFLGQPVPDVPFPHVNSEPALRVAIEVSRWVAWFSRVIGVLVLLSVFVCCFRPRRGKPLKSE